MPIDKVTGRTHSKHILALAIEDDGTRLQSLAADELGQCDGDRIGRSRDNWLRLSWVVVAMLMSALLLLRLLLRLHHSLLLLKRLPLEVLCAP